MSIDATRWAWSQQGIKPADKLLLLSLADRAGESHEAWPSITRLILDTGLDRRTIWAAISRLQAAGLIATTRKHRHSNRYRLIGVPDRHADTGQRPVGVQKRTPKADLEVQKRTPIGTKTYLNRGTKTDLQSTNEPKKNPPEDNADSPARQAAQSALKELRESFAYRPAAKTHRA